MRNPSWKTLAKLSLQFMISAGMLMITFPHLANAQTQKIQFKHLTIDDGLSQSWIHSIVQDKNGFIWIGTDDGLNRYDGYSFRIYKNVQKNPYSIPSNNIWALFEDSRGNFWIGTRQGLCLYDRENDRFIRNPQLAHQIMCLTEDKDRHLWVGTPFGLYHLNLENDSLNMYAPTKPLPQKGDISDLIITGIFTDSKNNVWVGTYNGLNLYDRKSGSFINYFHEDSNPSSLSNNYIRSIAEDKAGRLWIGTSAGLDLFTNVQNHPSEAVFKHYQNDSKRQNSLSRGAVLSLLEDDKHYLWIGVENGGLNLLNLDALDRGNNSFIHYKNDPNNATSLSNNSVYSIYQDRQGILWVGTFGNGINIIHPDEDKFIHFTSETGNKNSLINKQVNVFLEDTESLWIGTEGGLERYDKKNNTMKHFVHNPLDGRTIGSNAVWALCKDRQGSLWVGTWGGGLNRFDAKTETFEHYYNDPKNSNSIGSNNVFSICEDRKGNLWIGTMGGGLNVFDGNRKQFIRYDETNSEIHTDYVSAIIETKTGDLWLVNETAIECFDPATNRFEPLLHSPDDSTSLSSNYVISIFEDSKGNIWVGTDAGLDLYTESSRGFKHYQMSDGLPDNSINSILEDDRGNLWLGTNRGLSKFIDAISLPTKPKFRNFTFEDGLQSNGFGKRSCMKGTDGKLYFGGTNGFNVLNPSNITENTYVPPIVITDFQIFNKSVPIGGKESPLKKSIEATEELVLSYRQSVFSFDFAALNYISSMKNQYAYMLEGFDQDWNEIGTKHSATYTNLDPGKYGFRVKGSNNDGVWNEKGVSLKIRITPPFWKTLWFRMFLAVLIASALAALSLRIYHEIKHGKNALAHQENLMQLLMDTIPDHIYFKDTESRFLRLSKAHADRFGLANPEEGIGKTDFDFFTEEHAKAAFEDEQNIIRTGKPILNIEEKETWPEKPDSWVSTTKMPLYDKDGKIVGTFGISRDITEGKLSRIKLEQTTRELRELTEKLKRSNEELEKFAYVASHDLQEPLRMVSAYATLLARKFEGRIDSDVKEFLFYMTDGVKRMQILINDLLTYSRVSTQGNPFERMNLEEVFDRSLVNLEVTIGEKKAQITHDPLPLVMCDAIQMERLFQNLIGNAMKYCQTAPKIHISAKKKKGEWIITIKDNGIGIDPQYHEQIFGIFKRLHRRDEYSGTGIGLAVCQKTVERHGGKIWVESEGEGKGSTFKFTIPAS